MARGTSFRSVRSRDRLLRRLSLGAAALVVLFPVWLAATPASGSAPNAVPTITPLPTGSIIPPPSPPPAPAPSPSPSPTSGSGGSGGSGGSSGSGGGGDSATSAGEAGGGGSSGGIAAQT